MNNEIDRGGALEMEGTVEHIVYQNDSNGYMVCELAASNGDTVTLVGNMPFLAEGESIRAQGHFEFHANFGRQFKVEAYEKDLPADENAILKYLSSGAVRGIGKVLAKRIVERFGVDTFDVLENHPEWLADVQGITRKKAQKIGERFQETFGVRQVMMFCRDYFGPQTAVKIYQLWGCGAVDKIKSNPYRLCEEIDGIGFDTADKIAATLGLLGDSPERIGAGIVHCLQFNAQQNGHTFLPIDKLIEASALLLSVRKDAIRCRIDAMIRLEKLISVKYNGREVIYLKTYFDAEKYAADKLHLLDISIERLPSSDVDCFIDQLECEFQIEYAALQRKAIAMSVNSGVMILTGGPGTGKTTVIRAVIAVFERMGLSLVLAAPTGRAAKRMSEATGHDAKTVHRLLEPNFSGDGDHAFRRDENDTLDEDVIIIDEASMMDTLLFSSLLKAIRPGAHLLLIGDADQLPSVGAGHVLGDLIDCHVFSSVCLSEIFRQAESSLIVRNAHTINRGEMPVLDKKDGDFFFISRSDELSAAETIVDLCANRLPKRYGSDILRSMQVITPGHKGGAGTGHLNELLQEALNPPSNKKPEKKIRDVVFRVGDKVMQTKNNYDLHWEKNGEDGVGIFNGDIGVIEAIDLADETLSVNFDGRIAVYDFTQLDEMDHAYAITVHKSQGSEYGTVLIPVCAFYPRLMTRNLIYTAVTRAKTMVILVGTRQSLQAMIDNNRQDIRYTGLGFLLSAYRDD